MAEKRFYIKQHNWNERGVTINGWRVYDSINNRTATGTKGSSGSGGYPHRADAQRVCDSRNRSHEEVTAAAKKKNRRDK